MILELSKEGRLAAIFKALGDPTRLQVFLTLRACEAAVEVDEEGACRPAGSLTVGEVCCRLNQRMSTISHHLKELRLAGLIRMEKRGRRIYCSVSDDVLEEIREFFDAACRDPGCCE